MSDRDTATGADTALAGRCHCGNLELVLETRLRPARLPLRACTCTFCARHGARSTSDPQGRVTVTVHEPERLVRYRFGLGTADFLVCGRCGVYVAAVMTEGGSAWAVVDVNALDAVELFARAPTPFTYDGETADERGARRKARWTPALVVERSR
jgi:hypothetical protein